jgi:DNA-binding GntR family transcriptional regulator
MPPEGARRWPEEIEARRGRVLERLRTMIVTGELPPGTVIRDIELAQRLDVSNTPVREALVQLVAQGLVEMPPYRTKRVTQIDLDRTLDDLAALRLLGSAGYSQGLPALTEANIAQLEETFESYLLACSENDRKRAFDLMVHFQDIIVYASGNQTIGRLCHELMRSLERFLIFGGLFSTTAGKMAMRQTLAAARIGDVDSAMAALIAGHDGLERTARRCREEELKDNVA